MGAVGTSAHQVLGLNVEAAYPAPSCFVPASLLQSTWVIPPPCSLPSYCQATLCVPSPLHSTAPFPLARGCKEHELGSSQPLLRYVEVSWPTLAQCQPFNLQSPSPGTSCRHEIRVGVTPSTCAGARPPPCLWSEDRCCCPGPRDCFGDRWKQSAVVLGCLWCGTRCTI